MAQPNKSGEQRSVRIYKNDHNRLKFLADHYYIDTAQLLNIIISEVFLKTDYDNQSYERPPLTITLKFDKFKNILVSTESTEETVTSEVTEVTQSEEVNVLPVETESSVNTDNNETPVKIPKKRGRKPKDKTDEPKADKKAGGSSKTKDKDVTKEEPVKSEESLITEIQVDTSLYDNKVNTDIKSNTEVNETSVSSEDTVDDDSKLTS